MAILSGFLGAGKTTLVNRFLAAPMMAGTGVVVNEFGEVGIDAALVTARAASGVIELAGGCLCCTVRGELVETLAGLADDIAAGRVAPLRRLMVETSGLADPTPVVAALVAEPRLASAYRLDLVLCVLDARNGAATLQAHEEARRQAALADLAVLTKGDLASEGEREATLRAFRARNGHAPVLDAARGEATPEAILGVAAPARAGPAFARHLDGSVDGHGHHGQGHRPAGGIGSVSILWGEPIAEGAAVAFAECLVALLGPRLLRLKAVVPSREDPARPLVLHAVAGRMEAPERLDPAPDGAPHAGSRFVVIGEGIDERQVRDLFAAFVGLPAVDAPDRAAIENNPLAVPNFSFR